jgi:hypothetical protein
MAGEAGKMEQRDEAQAKRKTDKLAGSSSFSRCGASFQATSEP